MTPVLETCGLDAAYGRSQVLHGIDLSLAKGSVAALLGANGAGKTTTLRAICQMLVSTRGEIRLDGERIDGRPTERVARMGLAHVPDGRGTFLEFTTEENLRLGAHAGASMAGYRRQLDLIFGYFPRLGERRRQQAGTLSGGEQQMLAIGRALMSRPRVLLLDEPSFGLAPLVIQDIYSVLRRINRDEQVSILLVEQNASLAFDIADTIYLLETGRVVLSGPSEALRADDNVRRVYLGDEDSPCSS
jgi:branched-chain amino acid transport system ATP-binding protein